VAATTHDYESLLWAESSDLASLLDELDDTDLDRKTLCDGWRVRDVFSHTLVGHTTPKRSSTISSTTRTSADHSDDLVRSPRAAS
jgi:uncharacterized protein (TIGR03083 family)